jgi:3',5'-cyclic AMP phosphodiesterase CpdA
MDDATGKPTEAPPGGPKPLRIAVISDLHVVDDLNGPSGNTNIRVSDAGDAKQNPLTALQALIKREKLKADFLICPGDLCDRADPGGLKWAWGELREISSDLGAETLATTGNHDVDSRLAHKKTDTYGALLDLRPHFPHQDYQLANEYFARGIAVHETDRARVILVDSCFLHRERKSKQLDRGFLTPRVLDRVEEISATAPTAQGAINVLVCHHQPLRWTEFGDYKKGEMRGGERLVRILERSPAGAWILVHGHCHVPALDYVGQTSSGPVRFSAGSAGAALPATVLTGPPASPDYWAGDIYLRNQFYLLEVEKPGSPAGVGLAGRFRAWDWLDGWQPAKRESMIPGEGGFGYRASGLDLADWIADIGPPDLDWGRLVNEDPRLEHLAPCDMNVLVMALRSRGHGVLQNDNGRIEEVSLDRS